MGCPGPKPTLTLTLPTPPWGLIKSGSSCCTFTEKSHLQKKFFKNPQKISYSCQETMSWTNTGRRIQKQIHSIYPVYSLASNNFHLRDFKSSELNLSSSSHISEQGVSDQAPLNSVSLSRTTNSTHKLFINYFDPHFFNWTGIPWEILHFYFKRHMCILLVCTDH